MTPAHEVDYIVHDCFFAAGQAIGLDKQLDFDALVWWRTRYRRAFLDAIVRNGNSWTMDRRRVTAVGRFLGQRAAHHAGSNLVIDLASAARASADVECGCRMNADRESGLGGGCTNA
jgi:hypothetical protein